MSDLRNGQLDKYIAYRDIVRIVDADHTLDESEKDEKIYNYLAKFDDVQRLANEGRPGQTRSGVSLGESNLERKRPLVKSESHSAKRLDKTVDHSSRASNEKQGGDDYMPSKRVCLRESDMTWCGKADHSKVNPSCLETSRLLRIYHPDIPAAVFSVQTAPLGPNDFPSSQWKRIFEGQPVDLSDVLSSFPLPAVAGRRTVQTQAEWNKAWKSAAQATAFAFPHRAKELEAYEEAINDEFTARIESAHHKVVVYDIAVRNTVGNGCQLLLTDTQHAKLSKLYRAILMNKD